MWNKKVQSFVRDILFITNVNLIIDLFWEIGYRYQKGSCRYV